MSALVSVSAATIDTILIHAALDTRPVRAQYRDEYADHARLADEVDLPGDREHSWPNMAPLLNGAPPNVSTGYHPASGSISDTPPETAAETSGRHALTESMPAVVDDEGAMAVLAVVSGGDCAT